MQVLDVNDNAPVFTQPQYEVDVQETAAVGASVLKVTANDADAGDNGRVSYHLIDPSDAFTIDESEHWNQSIMLAQTRVC